MKNSTQVPPKRSHAPGAAQANTQTPAPDAGGSQPEAIIRFTNTADEYLFDVPIPHTTRAAIKRVEQECGITFQEFVKLAIVHQLPKLEAAIATAAGEGRRR